MRTRRTADLLGVNRHSREQEQEGDRGQFEQASNLAKVVHSADCALRGSRREQDGRDHSYKPRKLRPGLPPRQGSTLLSSCLFINQPRRIRTLRVLNHSPKSERNWLRGRDLNPRPSGYEPCCSPKHLDFWHQSGKKILRPKNKTFCKVVWKLDRYHLDYRGLPATQYPGSQLPGLLFSGLSQFSDQSDRRIHAHHLGSSNLATCRICRAAAAQCAY